MYRHKPSLIKFAQRLKDHNCPSVAVVDISDSAPLIQFHGLYDTRSRIGIGRDKRSPIGKHQVKSRLVKPQYTRLDPRTLKNVVLNSGDPGYPLGTHWIDIGNSFGIHGTNDPDSIGKSQSHGCIRMHNSDIAWVFDFLVIGSEVIIQE